MSTTTTTWNSIPVPDGYTVVERTRQYIVDEDEAPKTRTELGLREPNGQTTWGQAGYDRLRAVTGYGNCAYCGGSTPGGEMHVHCLPLAAVATAHGWAFPAAGRK